MRASSASMTPMASSTFMRHRRWRRIPHRALAPFLLFWCLGSFALGQEAARAPLLAIAASAVNAIEHTQLPQAHAIAATKLPRIPLVATSGLGVKLPVVAVSIPRTHRAHHKRLAHAAAVPVGACGSDGWVRVGAPSMDFPPAPWIAVYSPAAPESLFSAGMPRRSLSPTWMGLPPWIAAGMSYSA